MVATLYTNRIGGVSRSPYATNNLAFHVGDNAEVVSQNRRLHEQIVGPTQFMNQTHSDVIALVDGISLQEPNADGLVTTERGIALGVLVADCIPLLLWSREVVAAVHVGRKGLLNSVALNALKVMTSLGAGKIEGMLGPSICGKCYEVGEDVYEQVSERYPHARSLTSQGTLSLDLSVALVRELTEHGVKVTRSNICTVENPNFFSYRRDGVTGRQSGVIWL